MEDLQVIIKMSELKETESKIEEAKTREAQHKATLKELEQLKSDLGGRKENIIRVEKIVRTTFRPSDELARDIAFSVTNNAIRELSSRERFSDYYWQSIEDGIRLRAKETIEFSLRRYGYEEDISEDTSLEVLTLEKGSQDALEAMKAKLTEAEADRSRAWSEGAARYQKLLNEASALREQLTRAEEQNAAQAATVQKLRDELREALRTNEEKRESFLNKLISKL